jgi:GntR family transcriptional regulator / MocR family aminotransferase
MEPVMFVELDGRGPRYAQITRALLAAVTSGTLRPGARLPATRALAAQLGCSRNIVLLAYEQLVLEGYFRARPRAGTFVSTDLPRGAGSVEPRPATSGARRAALAPAGRRLAREAEGARAVTRRTRRCTIDFMYGQCEPDLRVVGHLRRGFGKVLAEPLAFGYGDPAGDEELRSEIAQRLHGSRGVARSAAQIVITNGAQQALDICARLLLEPGDRALVEDPGYEAARAVFRGAGATVVPIAVDAEGLDPSALPHQAGGARLLYVTPSHQFPTGAILSAARRHRVRMWARRRGVHILEDDYDGELRYHGQAIKALAGSEPENDVIYCGTFAKSLFPSVRIGYLALPAGLASAAVSVKWLLDRGASPLLQRLIRNLMRSGEYDRHLRRMQRRYAARRDALVLALQAHLGSEIDVGGDAAGMHLVAWFPKLAPQAVDALAAACKERDVGVYSIARHAVRPLRRGGLILGYGLLDEAAIEAGVRGLAAAYRALIRGLGTTAARRSSTGSRAARRSRAPSKMPRGIQ